MEINRMANVRIVNKVAESTTEQRALGIIGIIWPLIINAGFFIAGAIHQDGNLIDTAVKLLLITIPLTWTNKAVNHKELYDKELQE